MEYCVNKNKRNSDGTIDYDNMTWYLPAIDEIEDICIGGYSEFEVFQDKYYWSSQPAYRIGKMDYVAKVTAKPACSWRREEEEDISDGPDYYPCYNGHNVSYTTTQATITWSASTHYYDEGNQPRDAVNRVRCVYKEH